MSRIFNALNGPELLKSILSDIERELTLTGEFKNNITYPWVKYEATVKVLSYPKQNLADEPGIKVAVTSETAFPNDVDDNTRPAPEVPEVVFDLRLADVIDTPDKARVDSGQPIPTQGKAAGVLVDKLVHRTEQAVAPTVEQVKPRNTAAKIEAVLSKSATKPAEGSPVGIPGIDPSAQ